MAVKTWLPHIKVSFGGSIGLPAVEVWNCSLRFAFEDGAGTWDSVGHEPSDDEFDDMLASVGSRTEAWFRRGASQIGYAASLDYTKLVWIMADGKQRNQNTPTFEHSQITGAQGASVPWYQTCAITTRSRLKRGRGHAGRIFPPVIVAPVEQKTPYISQAQGDGMAGSLAQLLDDICNDISTASTAPDEQRRVRAIIASNGWVQSPRPPFQQVLPLNLPVEHVVCDRVHDVQHRRTHQVPRLEGNIIDVPLDA